MCEWAEERATQLDGLPQLLEQYEATYIQLLAWLEQRENDLQLLRSAHHLETEEEVMEQMRLLHQMEIVLEEEHSEFVRLSQLCNELVQRFEVGRVDERCRDFLLNTLNLKNVCHENYTHFPDPERPCRQ